MQKGFSHKLSTIPFIIFLLLNFLFAQQMDWTIATDSAEWRARGFHTSVVFDNKVWVIGGFNSTRQNDVWYSEDGAIWTLATASAPWAGRMGHTSVVFNNKMWVIGGFTGSLKNDVWYSEDGINWTQATSSANWSARCYFTSVVFNNKIWIFGGYNGNNLNDVWYSEDGINWICTTDSAEWRPRYDHTSLVFNNKMWILGGTNYFDQGDEVWYSTDGVQWMLATDDANWHRQGHSSVVFDNKMWVIGGNEYFHDVWYSTTGEIWIRAIEAPWSGRGYHTSVVFNYRIWVIGGIDNYGRKNDVWLSRGLTILTYPNGGEVLTGGYLTYIKWNNIGSRSGFARYQLLLSKNGYTYDDTIASNIAPSDTMYYWFIPYLDLVTGRIKIQVFDTSNLILREDASDGIFTIQTYIYFRYPRYNDVLSGGSVQNIRWFTYGTNFNRYRILFSRNQGVSYPDTIAHNVVSTETTYSWLVPSINSAGCRIKIQKIDDRNRVITERESEHFTINTQIWLATSQYPMFRYNQLHTGRSPYNGSQTPQVRWFYSTSQPITSSPIISPDSTIYFISKNDTIYAFKPRGAKIWQHYLGRTNQSTPVIASDNTIYVGDDYGNLLCLNQELSKIYWRYGTGSPILSSPVISNTSMIYVGSDNGHLYALNPDSTLRWYYNLDAPISSSPAIALNQIIFAGTTDGKLIAIFFNGVRLWEIQLPDALLSSPLVGPNGDIYIGCCNGKLYALDSNGVVKWNYQTGDSITSSAAIDSTGIIYFGSYDGYVYALEDAGNQANLIWRFQTQGKVRSSPSISANDIIYIGSDDGNIYAINQDGTLAWSRMTGNAVRSSPAIGADGTIYIGSDDGRLYAIGYVPSVEEEVVNLDAPKSFKLYSGQPNPFASITNIRFGLPRTSSVVLKIYSSSGVILKNLISDTKNPGYHTVIWDGTDYTGKKVPTGIYFCSLETGNIKEVKKIIKVD